MEMEQTAWLFTKDQESVRLELRTTTEGVQLSIDGPGVATSSYDFPPGTAVDSFRREYEQKLLGDGYRLQAVSERRVSEDRPAKEERRRGR